MSTRIIIGGGAAGFFAAIACAEKNPRWRVVILEKGAHVLAKVRISGGGRCNVTHACFDPKILVKNYPRGGKALLGPFHTFQPKNTVEWFERQGVALKTEEDGRMFPITDASITIVNALRDAAQNLGVTVRTHAGPETVEKVPEGYRLTFKESEPLIGEKILFACGSSPVGYQWAQQLGHTIESPVPSLFTFSIPDERLKGLAGLSVDKADVEIAGTSLRQSGPVLITHWGLSGPAVLKLSAWGARELHDQGYSAQININWLAETEDQATGRLQKFKSDNPKKTIAAHAAVNIPQRLWERLVSTALGANTFRWADVSNQQLKKLAIQLTRDSYQMRGKSTFKEEFVTCGGVRLDEVDFRTMESRRQPGLYFAGEILDIDGVTGGFNFQSAWTTGWIAGRSMAT